MLFALLQFGGTMQVSQQHPLESISMLAAIGTFFYGVVILPVLALGGGLPLLSARVRRSKALVAVAVVILCIPAVLLINLLAWLAYLPLMEPINALQRNHTTKAATVREGVPIPPGSKVQDADIGSRSYTVELAAPTTAAGMRWQGTLEVSAKELDAVESLLTGTLAEPGTFQGVPCARGKATIARHTVNCTLARNMEAHGFTLAAGAPVRLRFDNSGTVSNIDRATMAAPFRFRGTLWPAGVQFAPNAALAGNLEDPGLLWSDKPGAVCLAKGQTALFQGATLRGPVEVRFTAAGSEAGNTCISFDAEEDRSAYGSIRMPDGTVHRQGHIDLGASVWTWTDENVPAKFVDGVFDVNDQ